MIKLPVPARYILLTGLFFFILVFTAIALQNHALTVIDKGSGFTSYNHSKSGREAKQIMALWQQKPAAYNAVKQIIYSDYVLMLLYGFTIGYGLLAGYLNSKKRGKILFAVGMACIVAGVAMDAVQDYAIYQHLINHKYIDERNLTPYKFGCIIASLLILMAGLKTIRKRSTAARNNELITTSDFTSQPEITGCISRLENKYGENGKNLIVSDVIDNDNHQYVNLVQKGGGVLGVALVGYTYILEKMNIRFIRLAGTSAGAINTGLMTVIGAKKTTASQEKSEVAGNKKIPKSEQILKAICDLDFFDLVDGHPAARTIIKRFITNKDFSIKFKNWLLGAAVIFVSLLFLDFVFFGLQYRFAFLSLIVRFFFIITGFFILLLTIVVVYADYLIKRLKESGFGINPGNFFYDWIKKRFEENNVFSVSDLMQVAETPVADLRLREPNEMGISELQGDVTFITSEIVTENKIEFPKMWNLFSGHINDLHPAGFIRASMSIPVFFESYFINNIPCTHPNIKKEWETTFGETDPPSTARFVDGGILSNFPINLFYNPKVDRPRLPSFGIDLDDEIAADEISMTDKSKPNEANKINDKSKNADRWSLGGYLYRIFNTVRFYYDKDFLIKNRFFQRGIGKVPLKGFNWLNFFLSNDDKKKMFVLGAQAATRFLLNEDGNGFNWDDYKNKRFEMKKTLDENNPLTTKQ